MPRLPEAAARVARTIEEWCDAEFRPWTGSRLTFEEMRQRLRDDARRELAICLYRIADGTVDFHPDMHHRHDFLSHETPIGRRAHRYLEHLRDAVRIFGVRGTAPVGVFLADLYVERLSAPVFFFQKPAGARGLMIPDIDLLVHDYNLNPDGRFDDPVAFDDKQARAIFIGSTTGDAPLTRRIIEEGRNPRIAAARFFRDRDNVVFELPNICQEDGDDTRDFIRALEIGGPRRDWAEQQGYRYQVSIDGNGATCGRVAISLLSQSALLKYDSLNQLYYFHGLVPWRHYIPIASDGAVLDVIAEARTFADLHRSIADESQRFARAFLFRHPILRYTASMLARYIALFGRGGGPLAMAHDAPMIESAAQMEGGHWIWGDPGTWTGGGDVPVIGCALHPTGGLDWEMLRYRGIDGAGVMTATTGGGRFCAPPRRDGPLHGLAVSLHGAAAADYRLDVEERFADGHHRRSTGSATPARHPAPLTGMRVTLRPR